MVREISYFTASYNQFRLVVQVHKKGLVLN